MTDAQQDPVEGFVVALERLRERDDRAALAKLKRCSGRSLADCREVYGLFYRLLPPPAVGKPRLEENLFLLATLFPHVIKMPVNWRGDLGASLRDLARRQPEASGGIDRRIAVLLDSSRDELPFRLRQLVARLAAEGIGVDWRDLARALIDWDAPWRPVQKRWARSYFGAAAPADTAPAPAG